MAEQASSSNAGSPSREVSQDTDSPTSGIDDVNWYEDLSNILHGEHGDEDDEDDDPDYHDEPFEDEAEDEFYDAEDDVQFEVVIQNSGGDDDEATQPLREALRSHRSGVLTGPQLMALLQRGGLRNVLFANQGDDDDDDYDDDGNYVDNEVGEFMNLWGPRRRRGPPKDPDRFPKVPNQEGVKLMRSGVFGASEYSASRRRKLAARRALERELAIGDREEQRRNNSLLGQDMLPSSSAEKIIHYDDPVYSGQFSDDGNFFFACSQDFNVRMYDTSNPYDWKHYKTVNYPWGQWTLTDASLSPDNRWLAYTSIQSMVCIAPTDPNDTGDPYTLDLDGGLGIHNRWGWRGGGFGIWSIRFSGDGRELVAGTNAHSLVVYDIESRQVLHHIEGHEDDVNAVCFADKLSPHILYSGSDDATIKVWDRRSLGDRREVGAFVGHIEGITYIDSKGDGRYILSNGKDQSMKLWDLRMAMSPRRFEEMAPNRGAHTTGFDYRRGRYDERDWDVHPDDNSVVTFRGHKVLRTLIRCHFSPPGSTNSRYVYSGSADGRVYVYNMDASVARIIDVKKATMGTRPSDRRTRLYFDEPGGWGTCARDASWHPHAPMIVASSWNGYNMARGTCTVHSFNESHDDEGDPPMRRSVNNVLEEDPDMYYQAEY